MKKIANIIYLIISTISFGLCIFLFWAQSIKLDGRYKSDLYSHMNKPLKNGGKGYSLEGKIVVFLDKVTNGNSMFFIVFLALVVVLTPIAVSLYLKQMDAIYSKTMSVGYVRGRYIGLWSIFAAPIAIPGVWFYFYKNALNINGWHNSTSMEMRIAAIIGLAYFFKIQMSLKNEKKLSFVDAIILASSLLIATWFKPSFFVGLAPMMLVWLIIEAIIHIKDFACIKRLFLFGCTALPAGAMVILQYWKLYGSREDVSVVLKESQNYKVLFIRLGLFLIIPVLVSIFNAKDIACETKAGNTTYLQVWILWAIELAYYLIFKEDGRQGNNFEWGVKIGSYFVAITTAWLYYKNVLSVKEQKKNGEKISLGTKIYLCFVALLLLWQTVDGIYYFSQLLQGRNFRL